MAERRDNYFEQGVAALEAEDYPAAIEALTRAYRLSLGDLAEVLLYRGEAYFCLGEYDRALEDFEESIERQPRNPEAYNEHGNILRFQGQYALAIQDFTSALASHFVVCLQFSQRLHLYVQMIIIIRKDIS